MHTEHAIGFCIGEYFDKTFGCQIDLLHGPFAVKGNLPTL
jgi:hypothetical protein